MASGSPSCWNRPSSVLLFRAGHRTAELRRGRPAELVVGAGGAEHLAAWIGRVDREIGDDPAGPGAHDDDAVREIDRFIDAVGDEDHGPLLRLPKAEEIVVEAEAGDLVEGRKGRGPQPNPRLGGEDAGPRNAPLHAAGERAAVGA